MSVEARQAAEKIFEIVKGVIEKFAIKNGIDCVERTPEQVANTKELMAGAIADSYADIVRRLDKAVKFEAGSFEGRDVYVELTCRNWHYAEGEGKVEHPGVSLWAVRQLSYCLNKYGAWEYEPLPSSRTEEFLKSTRWNKFEDAMSAAEAAIKSATPKQGEVGK